MNIDHIKTKNEQAGYFFFEKGAMRFFNSRICPTVYKGDGGVFFITSEQFDHNSERKYTVRKVNADWTIRTVGEFNALTKGQAIKKARECSKGEAITA